jgi:hypothetical protein
MAACSIVVLAMQSFMHLFQPVIFLCPSLLLKLDHFATFVLPDPRLSAPLSTKGAAGEKMKEASAQMHCRQQGQR